MIAHIADAYRGMGRYTEAIEVSVAGLELCVALDQVAWTLLHLGLRRGRSVRAGHLGAHPGARLSPPDRQHRGPGDPLPRPSHLSAGEGFTLAQGIGNADLLNGLRETLADIG
ncbi:hypothetical protein [Herbidospora daliensis]|uniref:hypothetical protein n=1 Tax=Herbidospora daliensis TaxID=295585 RepID=UPI000781CE28|nr:hypothetical protein [Herbidospora daliensis]